MLRPASFTVGHSGEYSRAYCGNRRFRRIEDAFPGIFRCYEDDLPRGEGLWRIDRKWQG